MGLVDNGVIRTTSRNFKRSFSRNKKTQLLPHCEKTQHFHPPLLPPPSPPTWRRWRRRTAVATGGDGGGDGRRRRDGRRWLRRRTAATGRLWRRTASRRVASNGGGGGVAGNGGNGGIGDDYNYYYTTTTTKEGARGGRSRSRRFDLVALDAHSLSLSLSLSLFTARLNQALQTILASSASPVERAVALRLVEGLVALRLSLLRPAEAACARADRQAGCCCACAKPEARCAEA